MNKQIILFDQFPLLNVSNLFKHMNFFLINQSTHIIIISYRPFIRLIICLEQQSIVRSGEGEGLSGVAVSSDEILEEEFRILEIGGFVVVGLSVDSAEGFLKVFEPENESSDIYSDNKLFLIICNRKYTVVFQKVFILFNEFLGSELNVFIEQVDLQKLSLVVPVDVSEDGEVDDGEDVSHESESDVVGEGVVVICVEELENYYTQRKMPRGYQVDTESSGLVDKLVVLDGGIGHVVIPFSFFEIQRREMKKWLRSIGLRVKASEGTLGASLVAVSMRSIIFLMDLYLLIRASLE